MRIKADWTIIYPGFLRGWGRVYLTCLYLVWFIGEPAPTGLFTLVQGMSFYVFCDRWLDCEEGSIAFLDFFD